MSLNLLDSVYQIFEKVKTLTGKEVELLEKNDLTTYAAIKIARKNMVVHTVYFKSEHTAIINHLIAHECGHILRIYGIPEEDRLIPYTDDNIKMVALEEMESDIQILSKTLPFEKLAQIVNVWHTGIIRQLTNFPSDIMIERWIYNEYQELRTYQSQSLKKQYDEAVLGLGHQIEKLTPRKILSASNGLNCAFFAY